MGIYNLGGGGGAPELQAKEATPLITNAQQIILPDTEDGYDGLSRVTVNPMPSGTLKTPTVNSIGYVSSGVQTAGYFDTSATSGLQLSTQPAKTITPTTYSQTAVASGKYTTGAVTVAGDANLASNNIIAGKSIFGVNGNARKTYFESSTTTLTLRGPSITVNFVDPYFSNNVRLAAFQINSQWTGTLPSGDMSIAYFVADNESNSVLSNNVSTKINGYWVAKNIEYVPYIQNATVFKSGNTVSITITLTSSVGASFGPWEHVMHAIFVSA